MVTVKSSPSQPSSVIGVTVYIKSCGDVVPATKVNSEPGIVADAAVLAEPPSTLFEADNDTNDPIVATVTVTPSNDETDPSLTCEGSSIEFTITVNPTAQVNQPENLTLCNGDTAEIDFTTLNEGGDTTYVWQVVLEESDDIGPITTQGSEQGNINLAVENSTFDVLTATIEVTPTFTNNGEQCEGPSKEFTISVLPNV